MRPILFRGKRKSDGLWVKGYYGEFHNRPIIPEPNSCQIFEPREDAYFCGSCIGGIWHVVERDTVGQFTGLCDKNGKKIFEGDIVLSKGGIPWLIAFEKNAFVCKDNSMRTYFALWEQWEYNWKSKEDISPSPNFEVIGNIHDNPELLKGDKNV